MKYFDKHKWNNVFCKTPEELNSALTKFGIKNKKIKKVNCIGMSYNMQQWRYKQLVTTSLMNMGIKYDDIYTKKIINIDEILVPCQAVLCEPVVIVFEDNSTLEIMPKNIDGILLSINEIPADVVNGTNNQNFKSDMFFDKISGASINSFATIKDIITCQIGDSKFIDERETVVYQFYCSGKYGLYFQQSYEGWYNFGLTNQNCIENLRDTIETTTFLKLKQAALNNAQINIVEGHDSSSYFWIMPVKHLIDSNGQSDVVNNFDEQISIEEDDVGEFLYYFLEKYFDNDYQYGTSRDYNCGNDFEWNLEHNFYSYDTIKMMLKDIEHCSYLLKNDFENQQISELKKSFRISTFISDDNWFEKKFSETEQLKIIYDNIDIATDFYFRFVKRMKAMMEFAPQYNLISFMGP